MLPGPITIVIPKGGRLPVMLGSLATGNTKGAKFWSDGKIEAPMLPFCHALMRSPAEKILFWRDECKKVAEYEFESQRLMPPNHIKADSAVNPNKEDFYLALVGGMARNFKDEIYLRRSIWWANNDPARNGKTSIFPVLDQWNLRQLLELCDMSKPEERVWSAEIYRVLERFNECLELLKCPYPEDLEPYVKVIRERARLGDSLVAQVY